MYLPKNATLIYNFFRKICSKSNWQIRFLDFKNLAHDCVCKLVLLQSPPKPNNNFTCPKWECERIKAILAEADLIRNRNIDNTEGTRGFVFLLSSQMGKPQTLKDCRPFSELNPAPEAASEPRSLPPPILGSGVGSPAVTPSHKWEQTPVRQERSGAWVEPGTR